MLHKKESCSTCTSDVTREWVMSKTLRDDSSAMHLWMGHITHATESPTVQHPQIFRIDIYDIDMTICTAYVFLTRKLFSGNTTATWSVSLILLEEPYIIALSYIIAISDIWNIHMTTYFVHAFLEPSVSSENLHTTAVWGMSDGLRES